MIHPAKKKIVLILLIFMIIIPGSTSGLADSIMRDASDSIAEKPLYEYLLSDSDTSIVKTDEPERSTDVKEDNINEIDHIPIPIILRTNKFITYESEPDVPALFRSNHMIIRSLGDDKDVYVINEKGNDYFLLQFNGPVKQEWKTAVMEYGIELFDYIPDYAFIAYGDLEMLPEIRTLSFVNWIGPFHSYYRVQPELMELLQTALFDPAVLTDQIMVSLRPVNDIGSLLAAVEYTGALVRVIDGDNYVACDLTVGMALQL